MKILIAGDYYVGGNRTDSLIREGNYSFMDEVKETIKDFDISIVNFEGPIPNPDDCPIAKQGPALKMHTNSVAALAHARFDVACLANNHILDYNDSALINTKRLLENVGIKCVGAGINIEEASNILYLTTAGETLAIINCCEHEFSIANENASGANPINPIQQFYKIKEAKGKADFVIVITHSGHEMFQLPSLRMKENYRFYIDAGADAVINHHQHCFSGYEVYNGKPIFYGLGNFCFEPLHKTASIWHRGYMVGIDTLNFQNPKIIPYIQNEDNVGVHILPSGTYDKDIHYLNGIINDDTKHREELNTYYSSSTKAIATKLEPSINRIWQALRARKIVPNLIKMGDKLRLQNLILCESHRDKLKYWFEHT